MVSDSSKNLPNLKQLLEDVFNDSLRLTVPDEPEVSAEVKPCNDVRHGEYQCNNAMALFKVLKNKVPCQYKNPHAVGMAIMNNIPRTEIIETASIAGAGYVNVVLSRSWMEKRIHKMLVDGIETWAPKLPVQRAVVDFSSPNIAKELHVGHLRSTVIGDALARMLEFCNVEVLRRNHVGDWGTQFGMLIQNLFEEYPNWEANSDLGDIQKLYKESKKRFDNDAGFKERAQKAVVSLQGGEESYRKAWAQICEMSRNEFEKIYQRLGVQLEEKGESFYNPYIPRVLEQLSNMIVESDGAQVIWLDGFRHPLIVVKSDGGYNYASTDLAALWYRLNEEKTEWIIYVTDKGQSNHFEMVFGVAKNAKWLPVDQDGHSYPKATHVGFGVVKDENGKKFQTRASEVVRLADLLDEAKKRCKKALIDRPTAKDWTEEELEQTAEAVGYGAVKYFDLKNSIASDYEFSYDQMLNDKGDTAVYILYAHTRVSSIIRNSGRDIEELKKVGEVALVHPDERVLGLHLLKFSEAVHEACTSMLPNRLCEYLYSLAYYCTKFYTKCQVNGSEEETSRLLLCEATAVVMRKCFYLLGITPVYKL